jgi:hypothetical protein
MHREGEGYRSLVIDSAVEFDYLPVPGGQDGYEYRARQIIKVDA